MLPKKNRLNLKTKEGFRGKRIFSEDLTLIYSSANYFKGAVVVSKKVAPKAVDRNRIKRLVMESLKGKNAKAQCVFIVNKNLAGLKKDEVEIKVKELLRQINVQKIN